MLWGLLWGIGEDPISALNGLCRADLTVLDFFKNDLGRFTPCFIDLAVLGPSVSHRETEAILDNQAINRDPYPYHLQVSPIASQSVSSPSTCGDASANVPRVTS